MILLDKIVDGIDSSITLPIRAERHLFELIVVWYRFSNNKYNRINIFYMVIWIDVSLDAIWKVEFWSFCFAFHNKNGFPKESEKKKANDFFLSRISFCLLLFWFCQFLYHFLRSINLPYFSRFLKK